MKKQFTLTVLAVFAAITMFAQDNDASSDFVSKRGIPILPEAGDYSISVDASPFFAYFGNMFNGNAANVAPAFGFTAAHPFSITGKKMIDAKTAYRGIFRIGYTNDKFENYVKDDTYISTDTLTVVDTRSINQMNITLGVGLEKRRGKGRLQGIYGGQFLFGVNTNKESYEYGNIMNSKNISPTTTDWTSGNAGQVTTRKVSDKKAAQFGFNLQGFVGVEYFFAPKFSVSGEVAYGIFLITQGEGVIEQEEMPNTGDASVIGNIITGKESHFGFDTQVSAALNLNFYF